MSKTPWTPGPWEVLPLQDGRRAIYTDAESGFIGDVFGWEEDDPEQAEANARLIAASPTMAEVLADLRRLCSDTPAVERNPRFVEINQRVLQLLARIRGDAT